MADKLVKYSLMSIDTLIACSDQIEILIAFSTGGKRVTHFTIPTDSIPVMVSKELTKQELTEMHNKICYRFHIYVNWNKQTVLYEREI